MNPRLAALALIIVLLVPMAQSRSDCPANDPNIGPYNRIEILPKGYKLINEPFTVKAVRVDRQDQTEDPITGRSVKIYFYDNGVKKLIDTGTTNSKGEYTYTPTKVGRYMVECSGKAPMFDVKQLLDSPTDFGAVCGNGICEEDKLETNTNCPVDCTVCGDAVCEGSEDKENCPDDCIICGDGVCDDPEYWPGGCSCIEDCVICGDGVCDTAHGEDASHCAEDCGETKNAAGGMDIMEYWWVFAIVAGGVAGVVIFKKFSGKGGKKRDYGESDYDEPKGKKHSKKKEKLEKNDLEDDEDIKGIISELMGNGISDKRLKGKLNEFGLDGKEADELIGKAKKGR
jgi:hypothetical protein